MPYTQKTYEEIRNEILSDYANQIPGADISEGSDIFIKASTLASVIWGLFQYQSWIARQIFPDSADSSELERHANIRGLSRTQASKASGTVTLTGTNGTAAASGLTLKTSAEVYFTTTSGGTITNGVLDVTAEAKEGGSNGNIAINTSLTAQDPPAGIFSTASTKTNFTGGKDTETDSELLTRLLDIIRHPPAGGNQKDYERWALEVDGVTEAYIYPLRFGLGSVCVIPLTTGEGSVRIPTQTLLNSVKTYIDSVRPVACKTLQVLAPTAKTQGVTASVKVASGYTFTQVKLWVEDAIKSYINYMKPLETLYKSKLEKIISDIEGVEDRSVTVPTGNITCVDNGTTIEMIIPGTITITEMV